MIVVRFIIASVTSEIRRQINIDIGKCEITSTGVKQDDVVLNMVKIFC